MAYFGTMTILSSILLLAILLASPEHHINCATCNTNNPIVSGLDVIIRDLTVERDRLFDDLVDRWSHASYRLQRRVDARLQIVFSWGPCSKIASAESTIRGYIQRFSNDGRIQHYSTYNRLEDVFDDAELRIKQLFAENRVPACDSLKAGFTLRKERSVFARLEDELNALLERQEVALRQTLDWVEQEAYAAWRAHDKCAVARLIRECGARIQSTVDGMLKQLQQCLKSKDPQLQRMAHLVALQGAGLA